MEPRVAPFNRLELFGSSELQAALLATLRSFVPSLSKSICEPGATSVEVTSATVTSLHDGALLPPRFVAVRQTL